MLFDYILAFKSSRNFLSAIDSSNIWCCVMQEELRPYFSLPKVMDGLFNLAKTLFGIEIEQADGLAPVIKFKCS